MFKEFTSSTTLEKSEFIHSLTSFHLIFITFFQSMVQIIDDFQLNKRKVIRKKKLEKLSDTFVYEIQFKWEQNGNFSSVT